MGQMGVGWVGIWQWSRQFDFIVTLNEISLVIMFNFECMLSDSYQQ